MHAHAVDDLLGAKTGTGVVVRLPTRNDVDDKPPARQVPGEIAENLAGRGVVGEEKSIYEEYLAHVTRRDGPHGVYIAIASGASRRLSLTLTRRYHAHHPFQLRLARSLLCNAGPNEPGKCVPRGVAQRQMDSICRTFPTGR